MKVIRKTDGKVIEVKEWRGSSDVIYSELDMNAFYQASDLDFSVNETKDAEDAVIRGWVARDDGERWHERELHLFTRNKPERRKLMSDWIGRPSMTLDSNLFPDLTWDSEPMEVEITIKPKKK